MRVVLAVLMVLLTATCGWSESGNYRTIEVGPGGNIKWSPDGKYLSFTNRDGIMVFVVDSGNIRQVYSPEGTFYMYRHSYAWAGPDTILFAKNVEDRDDIGDWRTISIRRISVDSDLEELQSEVSAKQTSRADVDVKLTLLFNKLVRLSNGKVGLYRRQIVETSQLKQLLGRDDIDTAAFFVVSNYGWWQTHYWGMERDTDVWLVRFDGRPYKRVTTNKTYGLPVLSPDGRYILCRSGGMTVLDLDGKVVGHVDNADAESWLPDSRRLIFTRTVYAHDDIVAGDLYVIDITGENEVQITHTPDKIELDAVVSPDMTKVAYNLYKPDDKGIEIIDVAEVLR